MSAANALIPALTAALVIYALFKKVNVHKAFIAGARDALPQLLSILPSLLAMLTALELFKASGALYALTELLRGPLSGIGIAPELLPLMLLRPFSGSASLALLKDVLVTSGPDGYIGRAASVMVGSTETVFYTVSVYFGAVGVTKTRHSVPAALIAGAVGCAASLMITEFV